MAVKRSSFEAYQARIDEFKASPFSRYMQSMDDSSCQFLLNEADGSYKFRKVTQQTTKDGKFINIFEHGDVGTDGVAETVEYAQHGDQIRAKMRWTSTNFMDDYETYESMVQQREEEAMEVEKKAKKSKRTFPTLTAKLVYPTASSTTSTSAGGSTTKAAQTKAKAAQAKTQATWVNMLRTFLSTYDYIGGDFHHLDYSSADDSTWSFYETHEAEEGDKDMKKSHNALIKKDAFAKLLSKNHPNTYITTAEVQSHDYKIFELSIDGAKFFLLSYSMCYNDPMGHYNVFYNSTKKEIFRVEVYDESDPSVETGTWKSPAMEKKFGTLVEQIETFLVSGELLGCCGDFTFDFDEEHCV